MLLKDLQAALSPRSALGLGNLAESLGVPPRPQEEVKEEIEISKLSNLDIVIKNVQT
jgi:hypothetical protein